MLIRRPLSYPTALVAFLLVLSACSGEPADKEEPASKAPESTPLSQLAPGQRMPARMALGRQYAYMLVDITENDDALTGTMRIEIDGQSSEACGGLLDESPWLELCEAAASEGRAVTLEAPAEFPRSTVRRGDSLVMAGAYASFTPEPLDEPLHIGYVHLDGGDMLLIQLDGPEKDAPVVSRFKMSSGDNSASNVDNARLLIAESRT
ncbi:hypothetical protein WNY37_05200 [Henriciella sp. AS95]|uniref:hypothetical protein n=1 Tax=Henriciella sp. AS95 TaxID=3135782 RepID=UPI0031783414